MVTLFFSQIHKHCLLLICIANIHLASIEKLLEDTKGVIRSRTSKKYNNAMAKEKRKKDKKESTKIDQHEFYSNINTTLRECIVAERYGCKTTRDVQWSYGIFLGCCNTVFYCIYNKIAIDMLLDFSHFTMIDFTINSRKIV